MKDYGKRAEHLYKQSTYKTWGRLKSKARQVSFDEAGKGGSSLHKLSTTTWEGGCPAANDAKGAAAVSSTLPKNNGTVYIFCGFTWHRRLKEPDQVNHKHENSCFQHSLPCQCHTNRKGNQNWLWRCVCTQVNMHPPGMDHLSRLSVTVILAQTLTAELQQQ